MAGGSKYPSPSGIKYPKTCPWDICVLPFLYAVMQNHTPHVHVLSVLIAKLNTRAGSHDKIMQLIMTIRRSQSGSSEDSAVVKRPDRRSIRFILMRTS